MKFFNLLGKTVSKFWYLVIAFWIIITLALVFTAPKLSDLLSSDQGELLPQNSPGIQAKNIIDEKFKKNQYKSTAIIAIEDKNNLSDKDRNYIKEVHHWLESKEKPAEIQKVISTVNNPDMTDVLDSKNHKATMIIVGFNTNSTAPATYKAIDQIKNYIKNVPEGLKMAVTGEAAITRDYDATSQESVAKTTAVTVVLVIIILLIIYRSPIAPLIPLITIGMSLAISKAVVALFAQQGMKIADFTEIFIVVMLFGAGTDYCLFLISRYKEELANGKSAVDAVAHSVEAVGEAIASSAATVIVGMAAMAFAQFGMYNKTGPSLAISVAITLSAGLTLTPALLRLFGKFTFWPVKKVHHLKESQAWDRISNLINKRPGTVFVVTTLILLAFATFSTKKIKSNDMISELPQKVQSVQGYEIFKNNFKQGDLLPVTTVLKTKDDMWTANSINNIYQLTKELEKLKFVDSVRSVAQPNGNGKDFAGFLVPSQLQQVSEGLAKIKEGNSQLKNGLKVAAAGVDKGNQGTLQMKSGAEQIASGLQSSKDTLGQIATGLDSAKTGVDGVNSTLGTVSGSLGSIANNLGPANPQYGNILVQKGTLDAIVNGDPSHGVPKLADLSKGLTDSKNGLNTLAAAQGDMLSGQKGIVSGLDQTASGSKTLRDNLNLMADVSGKLIDGLGEAKTGLDKISQTQKESDAGYFYVPQEVIDKNPKLKEGMQEYISKDSHVTKLEITLKDKPYSDAAIKDIDDIRKTVSRFAEDSNFNTPQLYYGGANALVNNMKSLIDSDYIRMLILVIAGVFIILVLLMRSILSPVYLVLTILLSYIATMGITVILFQYILGQAGLDWKVPIFMFIMLVALGEDYNILLMSRVKEETAKAGVSEGVRMAVKKTGGIITSAGIIMAGTFGALMVTPLMSMVELGFAIAFGVLLDTFVVRPILVPAIIILLDKLAVRLHMKSNQTTVVN